MHKTMACSGFLNSFAHLNGVKPINASRLALARSLIALGPSHHGDQLSGPFWWSLRGAVTVFSLLRRDLRPTPDFMRLTASRRKADAFLLGEALTHWFAQTHLDARMVVPLEAHVGTWTQTAANAPYPKPMPQYFRHSVPLGAKSEPDFLAFSGAAHVHVLESKGRAGFGPYGVTEKDINAARNKALRQVCKVATVNATTPVTRTACVFAFDQSGLTGQITDPPATRRYDYRAELPELVKLAYASVLDPLFESSARPIDGEYMGIEFMPGWHFGIHKAVYKQVRNVRDEQSATRLLGFLNNFVPGGGPASDAENRSAGADGLILVGRPDFFEKARGEAI